MQFSELDIQVLMKLTLITPTNKKVKVTIPFIKKFCPQIELSQNVPTYIPLFHTLELEVITSESHQQKATINLSQILQNPSHEHYIIVQTYSQQKLGSRYAFQLQFAQLIVKINEANYLQVNFKKIVLKINDQKIKQMNPYLRVVVSHGSSWNSKQLSGSQLIKYDQSTTLIYHSLLDTVMIQIYSEKTKLCEAKKFIFQLLGEGSRIFGLQGDVIKNGSIKLSSKPTLPIIMID